MFVVVVAAERAVPIDHWYQLRGRRTGAAV